MSGTSLDGLDLCLVKFSGQDYLDYEILKADTVKYPTHLATLLAKGINLSSVELTQLDIDLGKYIGQAINTFLDEKIDFIASHGHTIFHQPKSGVTLQIGSGIVIHTITHYPVIYDFRTLDVALGGQGAPLVPIGDKYLFSNYVSCINFGGIANLSYQQKGQRIAFDICPVNMALNTLASELSLPFDNNGELARTGNIIPEMLDQLNQLDYYNIEGPKSLGIEWYNFNFRSIISKREYPVEDRLRTVCEHIAIQVTNVLKNVDNGKVLITGGGAYNTFLIDLIKQKGSHEFVVPTAELVEYKEALIFAFLGLLKKEGRINVLSAVTGAKLDSSSGQMVGF